jgi:hypothetical protein
MATLRPVDASQLLRHLTADAGRTLTPEEAWLIGQALDHLAELLDRDTSAPGITSHGPHHRGQGYAGASTLELRQLAKQLQSTAGLADALRSAPGESTLFATAGGF